MSPKHDSEDKVFFLILLSLGDLCRRGEGTEFIKGGTKGLIPSLYPTTLSFKFLAKTQEQPCTYYLGINKTGIGRGCAKHISPGYRIIKC